MQTFAPEGRDLKLGFMRLDYRRLGKQRVEAWQILNVLRGVDNYGMPKEHTGWVSHPATKMWRGHISALAYYGVLCCEEWRRLGYEDRLLHRFNEVLDVYCEFEDPTPPIFLDWVAYSHQSNLIRKDPDYYTRFWPEVPDNVPYFWPSEEGQVWVSKI